MINSRKGQAAANWANGLIRLILVLTVLLIGFATGVLQ